MGYVKSTSMLPSVCSSILVPFATLPYFPFYPPQVGAVDIDSGWSTGFNNFIFDTKKYPNASSMVSGRMRMSWA